MPDNQFAVVLAVFGTPCDQDAAALASMQETLRQRYPDTDVLLAAEAVPGTEGASRTKRAADALIQTLAKLAAAGYTHVAVQSLHVVPGLEFDALRDAAQGFALASGGKIQVCTGHPLIHDKTSANQVANALIRDVPPNRQADDAVVFVGHGTEHPAGAQAYARLQTCLQQRDPFLFAVTLTGPPDANNILAKLQAKGARNVWLAPLLAWSGSHMRQDIFGGKASWQKRLEAGGFICIPLEKPLSAWTGVAAIWLENAAACLNTLKKASPGG